MRSLCSAIAPIRMQIIPAIDILDGRCARLQQGDYDSAHVFADNPADMARQFGEMGAKRIHMVDLNAAKSGQRENAEAVAEAIAAANAYGVQVQIGGGLRTMQDVQRALDEGAAFAVIGTAAARNPQFCLDAAAAFPGQIILAADARNGQIATAGWREESKMHVYDLLDAVSITPPAAVLFTDIERDGMMQGANVELTADVAARTPCPLIASGGVRHADDVRALRRAHDNIQGAIVGRAIYEQPDLLRQLLASA